MIKAYNLAWCTWVDGLKMDKRFATSNKETAMKAAGALADELGQPVYVTVDVARVSPIEDERVIEECN